MSEWYLRDLSRKQRTAIRVKGESGKPTTDCAIYGYRKDPNDKYHWLIDEEAAAVVRRIFQLTIEGHGPYEIATMLCKEKVETPAAYFARQGRGVWKSREDIPRPYSWNGFAVGQILSKPEYMGHTVNFRTHKESYKDKRAVVHSPEDWLVFENTHEAIVDKETWELAQKLRKTPRRHDTIGEANPLTGLLYCADCGAKLYNHRSRGNAAKPYPSDWFDCSTYTLARQSHDSACSNHHISTKALRTLILETIRSASAYAISNETEFMGIVQTDPCQSCRYSMMAAKCGTAIFRFVGGCKPHLFLRSRSNSVREPNAQPAPATGLFTGFGVRPQQAETAVSGNAGNRSFEPLWEQRHCLHKTVLLYTPGMCGSR